MKPDKRETATLHPIGVIHTPYRTAEGTPVQTAHGCRVEGEVIVSEVYEPALADIEGFERLWLIYWMDHARPVLRTGRFPG